MIQWIAALAATCLTFVSGWVTTRRAEGPVAGRRLPVLLGMTAAAALGLGAAAATAPAEWWNFLVIPGTALEWFEVLRWRQRRAEAGSVPYELRTLPRRKHLLFVAALAVLGAFMELRANGVGLTNASLALFGLSNVALYLGAERYRPGLTERGILLLDGLIPWEHVEAWHLVGDSSVRLRVRLKDARRGLGSTPEFELGGEPGALRAYLGARVGGAGMGGRPQPDAPEEA